MLKWTKSSIVLHTFLCYDCALDPQLCTSFQRLSFQGFFCVVNRGFCSHEDSAPKLKTSICVKAWKSIQDKCLETWKTFTQFYNFITYVKWICCPWVSNLFGIKYGLFHSGMQSGETHSSISVGLCLESHWLLICQGFTATSFVRWVFNPHITKGLPPGVSYLPKRQSLGLYSRRFTE